MAQAQHESFLVCGLNIVALVLAKIVQLIFLRASRASSNWLAVTSTWSFVFFFFSLGGRKIMRKHPWEERQCMKKKLKNRKREKTMCLMRRQNGEIDESRLLNAWWKVFFSRAVDSDQLRQTAADYNERRELEKPPIKTCKEGGPQRWKIKTGVFRGWF